MLPGLDGTGGGPGDAKVNCFCGRRVAWNVARHRRSSACAARPYPVPDKCDCGSPWPCQMCEVAACVLTGWAVERTAKEFGLPLRVVKRAWHRYELRFQGRKERRGPFKGLRVERAR